MSNNQDNCTQDMYDEDRMLLDSIRRKIEFQKMENATLRMNNKTLEMENETIKSVTERLKAENETLRLEIKLLKTKMEIESNHTL